MRVEGEGPSWIRSGEAKTGWWWTMTAKGEPLPTIREIPDDICEQIHPVIQRRDTAGLHRALARSTTRSASSRALPKAGASPRTDPLPVMISSVAWQPSDSLDRVRQRPPTRPASPLGRPDMPVAHRQVAVGCPHPRVATGPWSPGVLPVAAGLHMETILERPQQDRRRPALRGKCPSWTSCSWS